VAWAGAAVLVAGLALSFSRGAWLGFALGLGYLVVALREARRAFAAAALLGVAVVLFASPYARATPAVAVVEERLSAFHTLSPYDGRAQIWAEAVNEITTHPWAGVGAGNFPFVAARSSFAGARVMPYHAHNLWLTWGAELGLPATLFGTAFLLVIARTAHGAVRTVRRRGLTQATVLVAGAIAGLLAVLVQQQVDYVLRNGPAFYLPAILIGVVLSARQLASRAAVESAA
jgi:O-antigen ligase